MDLDAAVSTCTPLSPIRPAMTLTFDCQNLIRSRVGISEYSLQVSIAIAQAIHELS